MRGRGGNRHGGGGGGGGGGPYRQGGGGGGGGGGGHQPMNRNHIFDSNGPDMRLRGTAQQLFEKYLQLGRDATGASDRVMAESYFQHAEHYFRILNAMSQASQQQGGQPYPPQRRYQDQDGNEGQQPSDQAEMSMSSYGQQNGNGQQHANGQNGNGTNGNGANGNGHGHQMDQDGDGQQDQRDPRDD
ncbi:DUF4167 domain-containing protein [Falsiroseomonas sp. E2-1-a20]|uniref:DUF4167 domain-containing protein n=1 Tax=Falsiroseomonas sp. E2-1-a20 TaxID=3239300 RepID=UPI003F2A011E